MTTRSSDGLVKSLQRSFAAAQLSAASDAELIDRFRTSRDEAAFEALVRRHGRLVLAACRSVLSDEASVEDAFQVTFLVLLEKAHAVRRRPSVGGYLYGVARRVALQARASAESRRRRERRRGQAAEVRSPDPSWRETCHALHQELGRLPAKYRQPLWLCYFEGQTRDEVAAALGCSPGAVKGNLERGRDLLRERLAKRGITLSAALLAAEVANSPAGASPPRLVQAVLAAATGAPAAAVAELAKRVAVKGIVTKSVLALAVVIGAVALGLGLGLGSQWPAAQGQPPDKPAPAADKGQAKDREAKPDSDTPKEVTYAGRVVRPDDKPVAGAKLYALYYTPRELPVPQRATSDKDGSFRFTVEGKEFDRIVSARPWDEVVVFAVADGYGLGFPVIRPDAPPSHTDLTVRLVKDEPITARVLDLQGKPVAGATVVVRQFWWPSQGEDLTAFVETLKKNGELYAALTEQKLWQTGLFMGRDIGRILPPAVTDADGRVKLKGVGRERVVLLRIEGPTIASTELWAMTRAGDTMRVSEYGRGAGGEVTFAGTTFEQVVAPGRPVVGVVRDKDSGEPIPGAVVESYVIAGTNTVSTRLSAVADKEGRYRLLGMPKAEGNQIRVGPPDGEPYLMSVLRVPDAPGLEPATADVKLKRGVWITGKVADRDGKPVPSWVQYAVHGDNPNLQEAPGLVFDHDMQTRPEDASFRFVGLPGRGVVAVRAQQVTGYRDRTGADKVKDLDRFFIPAGGALGLFNQEFHAVAEVNPEKGAKSATCDIVVVPSGALTGTVLDPDGQPLAGALVRGLEHPEVWSDRPGGAEFRLSLDSAEPRLLQFSHPEKKLAGSLVVRGDEKGPLTVKLEPAATLTGRFVTPEGKPLAVLELLAQTRAPLADPTMPTKADVTAGSFPRGPRTDKDGRFRIEGLAAGLTYRLMLRRGMYVLSPEGDGKGVTLKAGETKDLGDVKIKTPDE